MKYEVKEVANKDAWEEFLLNSHPNIFLQNWNWGQFNLELGRKIYRLGVFERSRLIGVSLVIKYPTQLGNYLYSPRGPILDWKNTSALDQLIDKIRNIAKDEKSIFIKLDPLLPESEDSSKLFTERGFSRAVTYVQVEDAWLLDLGKSEEELLAGMRKTTRYLIRHEPEKGIKVDVSDKMEDIKKFTDLLYTTASRKGFVNHIKEYYIKQFEILAKDNQMRIFKAVKSNKIMAMAVVAFYSDTAYYLHGASEKDAQSAGYPLQWEIIKEAKRRGVKTYNFWGVVKDKNFHPNHPWYGFSLFKRGFGGYKYSYIRAQDLPTSPKYWLYRYAEKSRRLMGRLRNGYWED